MGRVLPRENSWVEAVPCRISTQSTGSRWGWIGTLFKTCRAKPTPGVVPQGRLKIFQDFVAAHFQPSLRD